jgi:hypothetical protein
MSDSKENPNSDKQGTAIKFLRRRAGFDTTTLVVIAVFASFAVLFLMFGNPDLGQAIGELLTFPPYKVKTEVKETSAEEIKKQYAWGSEFDLDLQNEVTAIFKPGFIKGYEQVRSVSLKEISKIEQIALFHINHSNRHDAIKKSFIVTATLLISTDGKLAYYTFFCSRNRSYFSLEGSINHEFYITLEKHLETWKVINKKMREYHETPGMIDL